MTNHDDIEWARIGKWTVIFHDHEVTIYAWWVKSPVIKREFLAVHHWEGKS